MKEGMHCAVLIGQRAAEFQRFPVPEVDDDKLLVKVEACGICIWEQRVLTGNINTDYPLTGGHEVAGRIETTGKDVHGDQEAGQRVVVGITLPCRSYYFYKTHEEQGCRNFNTAQILSSQPYPGAGGFSEYMTAVPYSVLPYIDVTSQEACICEPVSCVIHSVETVNPRFGDACVIIGVGIMGLLYMQLCIKKGCFVIVVDMNEERLEATASIGAYYTINPHKEHTEKRVMKMIHGREAQAAFNTTSVASVVEEACRYVSNMRKPMTYNSIYPNKPVQMDAHQIHKGSIQILGTASSDDRDFMRAACVISGGIIDVKSFISDVYPVEEVSSALASSCQGNTFRSIIAFSEEL